jgi:hypothetical protein
VIASEVEAAVEQIEWPSPQSEFSKVEPRSIHSALFKFLYGRPVDSLAAIFNGTASRFMTTMHNARKA